MDEIEKILSQMKQGMSQSVFFHFEQLKRFVSDEDAATYIQQELEKMKGLFAKSTPASSLFSDWDSLEKEWQKKNLEAAKSKDYDMIYKSEEILQAIKSLKYGLEETTHGN